MFTYTNFTVGLKNILIVLTTLKKETTSFSKILVNICESVHRIPEGSNLDLTYYLTTHPHFPHTSD